MPEASKNFRYIVSLSTNTWLKPSDLLVRYTNVAHLPDKNHRERSIQNEISLSALQLIIVPMFV